ncbi:tetratricopeptide repeat protein [Mongoliibacter ruber]|uniref:Tfp pilus assembly protein PilF n=1 Tax=Mongoliibacter ruber TaxID=1750599 RepID=A0A2T0WQZ2_9BACT|nr:tetratricopeptide repeat protein [Mongoliibacter ruber]PRY89133.1 Tfp pilus assembly protein PilF [Mongoliibacter ruber]
MNLKKSIYFSFVVGVFSCSSPSNNISSYTTSYNSESATVIQGVSLLGDTLTSRIDSSSQSDQIRNLQAAEKQYSEDPSMENLIWIGRREAYLGRHDLAIRTFTKAIKEYPLAFEPLRHRGHRFVTVRKFDQAIEDFEKAVLLMEGKELIIEEDGMPNKLNIPLSNIQFNVWYHLGLAHYLIGDWEQALEAYTECLKVSDNDDLMVATLDWYYMTLMKMGKSEEAKNAIAVVSDKMNIIENDAYHKRILMYKGQLDPKNLLDVNADEQDQKLQYVTQGYGLGNYYLTKGDTIQAESIFQNVIETGYWAAFGYIASEMELAKLKE